MVTQTTKHEVIAIDGPNIDGVLGTVLGRKPMSNDRPCWDIVRDSLARLVPTTIRPQFFVNGWHVSDKHFSFFRALRKMSYDVKRVVETGLYPPNDDPVDEAILRLLDEAQSRAQSGELVNVTVFGHDHVYANFLQRILAAGGNVNIAGFREELSPALLGLKNVGAQILDLQYDLYAFRQKLPRFFFPAQHDFRC